MSTFLFDRIVFGPVHSRRLGVSLGVNLLPPDGKLCSFNCIYCECGLNEERRTRTKLPARSEVKEALAGKLRAMQEAATAPDVITFAGNGEPTLHPEFAEIIDDTVALRDRYFPQTKIAVLSNATRIDREDVFRALLRVDDNILKLDSVSDSRIRQLDQPNAGTFTFGKLLADLKRFEGKLIIQTMFLKGESDGCPVNNMTEPEITGWLDALKEIRPRRVMIYTLDRDTPVKGLLKASPEEMEAIAERARREGFDVTVSV